MKEKKISPEWNIAANHWITAGFAIPLISGLILSIPLRLIAVSDIRIQGGFTFIVILISVWLGVVHSSKYLDKKYVIKDADEIINLATLYFLLIGGSLLIYEFILTNFLGWILIGFLPQVMVFYFVSKKYVKNNSVSVPQSQVPSV